MVRQSAQTTRINVGSMIAVVGGDGSGKSTTVDNLTNWLSTDFDTDCIHLGKPPWSWTTHVVRCGIMLCRKLRLYDEDRSAVDVAATNSTSVYPVLLRAVCKARDRYLTYVKARGKATTGTLVICDRFPVPQIRLMDGPNAERIMVGRRANHLTRFLTNLEKSFYEQIGAPDLLIVLRLDPETAVRRKTEDDAAAVRTRNEEIWRFDWRSTCAYVIDAEQPQAKVLSTIKQILWQKLYTN